MRTLDGKVAVITGAGSGIGRALARKVADSGARLAISDWDEAGLAQTTALLEDDGVVEVRADRLDVREKDAVAAYATEVKKQFGTVNLVINNAGVSHSGPVTAMTYEDFEWLMAINFWGVVYGTKEFLPHLIESGDGHLVNLSSLFGLVAMPGQSTYNSAKFAVRGFTESVRQDMIVGNHPVGVTCVHPGGVKTGIARNGRVTTGEDHAKLARTFDEKLAKMSPETAAEIIVKAVLADRARVLVGADAHLLHWTGKLLGARYQDLFARLSSRALR